MSNIQFIPNDPENILAESIATYSKAFGQPLNPADSERLMIDLLAYRETVLRGSMEHLMRQNFVQYAVAPHLDNWGTILGVVRHNGESDDSYRQRILNSPHNSVGTESAYRNAIMAIDNVADLVIERKSDDNTLPPGVVRLILLMRSTVDGITCGNVHNAALESAINAIVYDDNFGVVGPIFIYKAATPIAVNGTIIVRPVLGYTAEQIKTNIKRQVNQYFGALSLSFTGVFGVFDLERAILLAEGVLSIVNLDFANVPILRTGEFYTAGQITTTIQ